MPQPMKEVLHNLSEPQRKVVGVVGSLIEISTFAREADITDGNKYQGIVETKAALQQLVELGVLVKEIGDGTLRFKFSEAVIQAGGPRWIMKRLTS